MRPILLSSTTHDEIQQVDVPGWRVAYCTVRSPDQTTDNEDSIAIIPIGDKQLIVAVADGMGGHAAGEVASQLAVDNLAKSVADAPDAESNTRAAILNGIESANQAILDLGTGAGSTLSVAELSTDGVRTYHVGDSLILQVGNRGKVKVKTTSHSPVGYGIAAGLLDVEEARTHEDSHVVLNVIGCDKMRIEIGSPQPFARRDTLLLASDGLSDNLSMDEIVEQIRAGVLRKNAERLLNTSLVAMNGYEGKTDDLSFILVRRVR